MKVSQEFRAHAAECQELARLWREEGRRQYEELARQWLELAERVENSDQSAVSVGSNRDDLARVHGPCAR
jgi:hypothetical protein